MRLDSKNRQILYQLDSNARQPVSSIAKAVSLSKQSVHYRIQKLLKEKIIHKLLTVIDLSRLGIQVHKAYFRFQGTNLEKEKEIIAFLKQHENISWLVNCEGRFDIALALHTKSMEELDIALTSIENKFGGYFSERIVNTVINTNFFPRAHLLSKEDPRKIIEGKLTDGRTKAKIDEKDIKILRELSKDARREPSEMVKNIGLTEDAIRKRIRNLEKGEIIKKYVLIPDDQRLSSREGISHHKILLNLQNYTENQERKFTEYCKSNSNIFFMNKNIGVWDMEIDIESESEEEYRKIVRELKKGFSNIIRDFFVLKIYQMHKFNFLP